MIRIIDLEGVTVVQPRCELTAEVGDQWRGRLASLDDTTNVVIDLEEVPFMDSAGLGVLIGAIRRIRAGGGEVVVVSARPPMRRLLYVTGLDRVAVLLEDLESAVDHLLGGPAGGRDAQASANRFV